MTTEHFGEVRNQPLLEHPLVPTERLQGKQELKTSDKTSSSWPLPADGFIATSLPDRHIQRPPLHFQNKLLIRGITV